MLIQWIYCDYAITYAKSLMSPSICFCMYSFTQIINLRPDFQCSKTWFFHLLCPSFLWHTSQKESPLFWTPLPPPPKTFLSKVGHPHLGPISPFQECLPEWVGWPIYCISIFLILLTLTPKFHRFLRSLRRVKSWQFWTSEETQRDKIKSRMAAAPLSSQMHHLESEVFWPCRLQRLRVRKMAISHLCNKLRRKISILTQFRICLPQET